MVASRLRKYDDDPENVPPVIEHKWLEIIEVKDEGLFFDAFEAMQKAGRVGSAPGGT